MNIKPNQYVRSQIEQTEADPTRLQLDSNSSKRLRANEAVKPCLRTALEPVVAPITQMNMLTHLNIADQQIGDRVYFTMLGALKQAGCALKKLNVSGNNLSCLAFVLTAELLDKACYDLQFSDNPIGDAALELIADQKKQFRIERVALSHCNLTPRSWPHIVKLATKRLLALTELDLSANDMEASGQSYPYFMEMLETALMRKMKLNLSQTNLNKLQVYMIRQKVMQGEIAYIKLEGNQNVEFAMLQQLEFQVAQNIKFSRAESIKE